MRYVILPQALRRMLPPLAGEFITLLKDSSLLSVIAVPELMSVQKSDYWPVFDIPRATLYGCIDLSCIDECIRIGYSYVWNVAIT